MLEERTYEDYEEFGGYVLGALEAAEQDELGAVDEVMRAMIEKATLMWGDDPRMEETLLVLTSLQHHERDPYLLRESLWTLRGRFHEAFERDAKIHQAFVSRLTRTTQGRLFSPLFSAQEKEQL